MPDGRTVELGPNTWQDGKLQAVEPAGPSTTGLDRQGWLAVGWLQRGHDRLHARRTSMSTRELPFPVKVPNATTIEAMQELEEGKGKRFDSAEELFEDLGL